jgi:hypothetical protein
MGIAAYSLSRKGATMARGFRKVLFPTFVLLGALGTAILHPSSVNAGNNGNNGNNGNGGNNGNSGNNGNNGNNGNGVP